MFFTETNYKKIRDYLLKDGRGIRSSEFPPTSEDEFDLINSANRVTLRIDKEKASNEYYQYLILVDEIKQYYKQYFNI